MGCKESNQTNNKPVFPREVLGIEAETDIFGSSLFARSNHLQISNTQMVERFFFCILSFYAVLYQLLT